MHTLLPARCMRASAGVVLGGGPMTQVAALQGAQQQLQQAGFEGVLLGGNYVAGVALGKCVEYAYEYAGKVASFLQSSRPALATAVPPNSQQDDAAADAFGVPQN